jgi:hypothetical protein
MQQGRVSDAGETHQDDAWADVTASQTKAIPAPSSVALVLKRPIDSNATAAGREHNRRVETQLSLLT